MPSFTPEEVLAMQYQDALTVAQARSIEHKCTIHVNAVLLGGDPPRITGFRTDDWYDGSTVATFTNGHRF